MKEILLILLFCGCSGIGIGYCLMLHVQRDEVNFKPVTHVLLSICVISLVAFGTIGLFTLLGKMEGKVFVDKERVTECPEYREMTITLYEKVED